MFKKRCVGCGHYLSKWDMILEHGWNWAGCWKSWWCKPCYKKEIK